MQRTVLKASWPPRTTLELGGPRGCMMPHPRPVKPPSEASISVHAPGG